MTTSADAPARSRSHFNRYREIGLVLSRHGLAHLARVTLGRFALPLPGGRHSTFDGRPEQLREMFEDLGTTFVKLGQILSTRPDLVSPGYQAELAKLQDTTAPVEVAKLRAIIEADLGKPIRELFKTFDDIPLAAASIGQVHAATLHDGSDVVVKVRRPGVVEQVELDLEIMASMAKRAVRSWEWAQRYDAPALVQEFAETMRRELNYTFEAKNAERFAENFADDATVHIPKVYREFSSERVLTLERIRGLKITDKAGIKQAGIEANTLADTAVSAFLKMVFEDGFYHADPHPGNYFVEAEDRIGLVDFGMVGLLDDVTLEGLMGMIQSLLDDKPERVVDALEDMGCTAADLDRVALRKDITFLTEKYGTRTIEQVSASELIQDVLKVARKHWLRVPTRLAMLFKALAMAEGVGAQVDPTFNLTQKIRPYAQDYVLGRPAWERKKRRLKETGMDALALTGEFPIRMRRILKDLERGGIGVNIRHTGLEDALQRFDRTINRLIMGILAAAFVIGLGIVLSVADLPGKDTWLAAFFVAGLAIVVGLGLYLAWRLSRAKS